MNICEYYENCTIFIKASTGRIKGIYSVLYCKGSRMEECERRRLIQLGKDVPVTLLPTGNHMMSLSED